MLRIFTLLFLLIPFATLSQDHVSLNPEERAYLFHIVKKSPILDQNIGRYFDYQGPQIKFGNGKLNYDSIEQVIIFQPDVLVIRHQEIAKSTKGIIAEAANKMAIWELNKMLLAKRVKDVDFQKYQARYDKFEAYLLEKLPSKCLDETGAKPNSRMDNVLNPGLTLDDKIAQLSSFRGMTKEDELTALKAINYAINKYVEERTFEIYKLLGGEASVFKNVLTAAGDGSDTSGLLDEREKDEKGKWNRGLPKAVGFFPYNVKIITPEAKKATPKIVSENYTVSDFFTAGNNRATNLHFDVWGYNSSKQTTVVVEKNGKCYHLFGSGETRFLSPDSSFSKGSTFQAIINDLEFNKIATITERIEGKRGYDYLIEDYKKKKDQTELKIEKAEKEYSDMGYSPITTSKKPSRKTKKNKKIAVKAKSGADSWKGAPTTSSNKKSKSKLQHEISELYKEFEWYGLKIKELEQEKLDAIDLRARYQMKLDKYKQLICYNRMKYSEKDGFYIFEDSSTFDMYTQEFQFQPSELVTPFEVKLIAIPFSSLSDEADEVMLHVSMVDSKPNYDARLQIAFNDQFQSDSWAINDKMIKHSDSVAVMQFFEALLDSEKDFSISAKGQGVGIWNGVQTVKNSAPIELTSYPEVGKMDSTFTRLRYSELLVHTDRDVRVEVNSYTDPVRSSIEIKNEKLLSLKNEYKLTQNDLLSAYRSAAILIKFKEEMNVLAGKYLDREKAKIVIDKLNREIAKTKVTVGAGSLKLSDFGI